MRSLLTSMLLGFLLVAYAGCGGTPDPQDREDFVDTTKPDVAAEMLEKPGEEPKPPASDP